MNKNHLPSCLNYCNNCTPIPYDFHRIPLLKYQRYVILLLKEHQTHLPAMYYKFYFPERVSLLNDILHFPVYVCRNSDNHPQGRQYLYCRNRGNPNTLL